MLLGASTASGAEFFLDLLDFNHLVADVDLVVTGDGRLDHQTLQGKLRAAPTPVVAVVGRNDLDEDTAKTLFADVFAVTELAEGDTSRNPHRTAELLRTSEPRSDVGSRHSPDSGRPSGHTSARQVRSPRRRGRLVGLS